MKAKCWAEVVRDAARLISVAGDRVGVEKIDARRMVLKVLREDSTGEMEISGCRSELLALGRRLRGGRGEIDLPEVPDPFPYDKALSRIELRQTSGKIRLSSSGGGEALEVQGGLDSLALLADNIEGFAMEADQGDHLHVNYFPGHDYLGEGSDSLVIGIDGEAPIVVSGK